MEQPAEGISVGHPYRRRYVLYLDASQVRCGEPGCAKASRRERGEVTRVPSERDGCELQRGKRGLCRRFGQEPRLQENLRFNGGLPRRPISLVAGGRIQLRHLPN